MGKTEKRSPIIKKIILSLVAVILLSFPFLELLWNFGLLKSSPSGALLSFFSAEAIENETEYVRFLSVGQGDCTIIKSRDKTLLIDFGLKDESDSLYWKLKELGIGKIDLALVTHCHKDHIGGFADLAERMEIKAVIVNDIVAENADKSELETLISAAKKQNIKLISPKAGEDFLLGGIKLKILYVGNSKKEENNRSVISKVILKNKSLLFMGDTEGEMEKEFLKASKDVAADIIKLGHHGSYTSTGYELLRRSGCKVAIASSGYNNSYGHPSDKVLERLKRMGISHYRTDLDGDIICKMDKDRFTVFTERENK